MGGQLAIMLHGGAGRYEAAKVSKKLPFLKEALNAAWKLLVDGASGEQVLAAALRVLEGSEYFNAGYGGYTNENGQVFLDIGLMKGNGSFRSLLNVRRVKYPSAVALDLFERQAQLMTTWTSEDDKWLDSQTIAKKEHYGFVATDDELVAPFVRQLAAKKSQAELEQIVRKEHGTVGCVVRDAHGAVFAGTSTGGVYGKLNGRIGDSPIIGSGVYADNAIGALSTSGHGEIILASAFSGYVLAEMRRAIQENSSIFETNTDLLQSILNAETKRLKRYEPAENVGIIVVPIVGAPRYAFNTDMFSLAYRTGDAKTISTEKVFIARNNASDLIG